MAKCGLPAGKIRTASARTASQRQTTRTSRAFRAAGVLFFALSPLVARAAATSQPVAITEGAQAQLVAFDIPAMPLAEALQRFAQQAGHPLSFDRAAVGDVQSNSVSGLMTAEAALQRLLDATGIGYRRSTKGVWLVGPRVGTAQGATARSEFRRNPRDARASSANTVITELGDLVTESLVVSASRTPQNINRIASDVSLISLEDTAAQQIDGLKGALGQQPGVTVVTTGAVGGDTYVFVRGAYSHHTLLIVDGVRMNDRSASYSAFMSYADLSGVNRIEVLRGPQSPMYGSAAIGGVVLVDTMRGTDEFYGAAKLVGGSFDTVAVAGAARGAAESLDYSVAAGRYRTANDTSDNDFDSWSHAAQVGFAATERLRLGATLRVQEGEYAAAGSRTRFERGLAASSNELATLYANWEAAETISTRFIAGLHRREYRWHADSPSAQVNDRRILDWQTAWRPTAAVELVGGLNHERSDYEVSGLRTHDDISAVFLSGVAALSNTFALNAGVRYDDFASVGDATTWRAGAAWIARPNTKLRATYGTGFAAPGSSDRYGVSAWGQLPNPDLMPETSRGWDLGVDYAVGGDTLTFSVTYFENRFERLIDWIDIESEEGGGMFVNRREAKTRGAELGAALRFDAWQARLSYTYLDAADEGIGQRLSWRPRHSFDVSAWFELTANWLLGFGVSGVADRVDHGNRIEDYSVVRLFASWKVLEQLSISARVENLLDERYDEVYGYRSLPRGFYGSVEWAF
jgi:vitamin B12 transporter